MLYAIFNSLEHNRITFNNQRGEKKNNNYNNLKTKLNCIDPK